MDYCNGLQMQRMLHSTGGRAVCGPLLLYLSITTIALFFAPPSLNNTHTAEFMLEGEIDCIVPISLNKKAP